jgi:hypothetical protein
MAFGNQKSSNGKIDKPETGALFFIKERKNDNSPHLSGNIILSKELLQYCADEMRENRPAKLSMACWENTSKKGTDYYGLKVSEPLKKEDSNNDDDLPF